MCIIMTLTACHASPHHHTTTQAAAIVRFRGSDSLSSQTSTRYVYSSNVFFGYCCAACSTACCTGISNHCYSYVSATVQQMGRQPPGKRTAYDTRMYVYVHIIHGTYIYSNGHSAAANTAVVLLQRRCAFLGVNYRYIHTTAVVFCSVRSG